MPPPVDSRATDPATPGGERVAKLLARAGVASRREVERMIADGRVARDGVAIDTPATVLPSLHGITVDGQPVALPEPARLFLYHKPTGLLVTEHDPRGRPTIYDRLPSGFLGDLPRVVPVGRLDLNTEGLLLLTTDGGFKRQLELPATGVERSYRARCYGQVTQAQLEELIEGVEIEGIRYGAIDANLERRTGANVWIELTLTEGKNREVRRVLEHLGLQVGRLIRTRYGPFVLGDLPPGEIGEVRQTDLLNFRQTLGTKRKDDLRIAIPTHPREASSRRPARGAGAATATRATPRPAPAPRPATAPRPAPSQRLAPAPRPRVHPGAGRGPVASSSTVKPFSGPRAASRVEAGEQHSARSPSATGKPFKWRGAAPSLSAPQLDPGLRRNGATAQTGPGQRTRTTGRAVEPVAARAKPVGTAPDDQPPRPAKPQRKAGWAKPKPKSGPPRRPGKPRA